MAGIRKIGVATGLGIAKAAVPGSQVFTILLLSMAVLFQSGCAGVNTFPAIARPGDTVSVMIGGSEQVKKNTISAMLTDANGVMWDLQQLGKIRSVFNLRPDGRAYGLHYSSWLDTENAWLRGHEPMQTVMVFDLPDMASGIAYGPAALSVNLNSPDDASGITAPFAVSINIVAVPGSNGTSDSFLRQMFGSGPQPANFQDLEPAPYAKISFGDGSTPAGYATLYAVSLVMDFDENVVNGDDIDIYIPESTVRGTYNSTGPLGKAQRMVFWHHDGTKMFIDVIAPQGIEGRYLQIYMVHPRGLPADPGLNLISTTGYDLNGNTITATPQFSYFP